ncbi:MAG: hypothetical protein MZV63_34590 [Marinilabiliales bacterium]|nr:hypothetical protein [Marinilabiliales bacterium]
MAGGLAGPFDVSLKLSRDLSERLSLNAGYRTIEGGANVDAVYTFAWLPPMPFWGWSTGL